MEQVPFHKLSDDDVRILGECLRACVEGPFFPDWEFQTLFGLERSEVAEIAQEWPHSRHVNSFIAVNNALANLLGYPH